MLKEPLHVVGKDKFAGIDIRIRVKGGGHVAQIYGNNSFHKMYIIIIFAAIRQAIAKSLVAYYQKCNIHLNDCYYLFFRRRRAKQERAERSIRAI